MGQLESTRTRYYRMCLPAEGLYELQPRVPDMTKQERSTPRRPRRVRAEHESRRTARDVAAEPTTRSRAFTHSRE